MLIANMIEEEALMGGVGVVSALSRGDIALLEIAIPQKLRHFKMNDGVARRCYRCLKAAYSFR